MLAVWDEAALPKLEQLLLRDNVFYAGLNADWGRTRLQLAVLDISSNKLQGYLPPGERTVGRCNNLSSAERLCHARQLHLALLAAHAHWQYRCSPASAVLCCVRQIEGLARPCVPAATKQACIASPSCFSVALFSQICSQLHIKTTYLQTQLAISWL